MLLFPTLGCMISNDDLEECHSIPVLIRAQVEPSTAFENGMSARSEGTSLEGKELVGYGVGHRRGRRKGWIKDLTKLFKCAVLDFLQKWKSKTRHTHTHTRGNQ